MFDLNSPHKKPYETIIIGKLKQVDNHDKNDSAEECNNNEDLNCTNKDSNSCLDNPFDKAHYGSHNSDEDCDIEDLKDSNCATNSCHDNNIPDNQVIVSIPCSLHSKKPPLIGTFNLNHTISLSVGLSVQLSIHQTIHHATFTF